jgi:hypothetical protein
LSRSVPRVTVRPPGAIPLALDVRRVEAPHSGGWGPQCRGAGICFACSIRGCREISSRRCDPATSVPTSFYRLSVFPVRLPPLRERREDVPPLVAHFIRRFADRQHRPVPRLSPGVMNRLLAYDWPGNIRELQNVVERAVILARGSLITEDLFPPDACSRSSGAPKSRTSRSDTRGPPRMSLVFRPRSATPSCGPWSWLDGGSVAAGERPRFSV